MSLMLGRCGSRRLEQEIERSHLNPTQEQCENQKGDESVNSQIHPSTALPPLPLPTGSLTFSNSAASWRQMFKYIGAFLIQTTTSPFPAPSVLSLMQMPQVPSPQSHLVPFVKRFGNWYVGALCNPSAQDTEA